MADLIRELFVGLGGTGGNVLRYLFNQMNEEQRRTAKYVFIDTDQKDIDNMEVKGIRCVPISNADTVLQVARQLGQDDGVADWLPTGSSERIFLNSRIDDGAGQCRFKSRLCLARFLKNDAPGLKELLEEMTRPGAAMQSRLRVVIVSSIAGGTGAGTFIQMALYIRKFFRKLNQKAEIIGIFSCPDLYTDFAKNEIEKISMFANAYAAIRELNAMNLVTNHPGAHHLQGYGMKVDLKLKTRSEGVLFDSTDPAFKNDESAKPFDLIYFVDKANERGGILRDIQEYYRIMADVAYTRLYSPLNASIASGESNELRNHTLVPTAIYGSAGYARILYPYKDIVRYLTEKKLYDELGDQWLYFDALWDAECQMEQDAARAYGGHWAPKAGQRGKKFRDDLNTELTGDSAEKSRFAFLKTMVFGNGKQSRVNGFKSEIKKAASSLGGGSGDASSAELPEDKAVLRVSGGKYSVLRDSEVIRVLEQLMDLANPQSVGDADGSAEDLFAPLQSVASQAENIWGEFASALENAVKAQSQRLASAILPLTEIAVSNHDRTSPISLRYALLSRDSTGDVHPLAARYLLYGLQEICLSEGSEDKNTLRASLDQCLRKIRLALDDDADDDEDITVDMVVDDVSRRWMLRKKKESLAEELLDVFCSNLKPTLAQALIAADSAVVSGAYSKLKEPVGELISLYEGFFRTIAPYRDELNQQIYTDLVRHDSGGNQTIFVGASSKVKRVYSVEPSIVGALTSDPDATCAAAGAGVFENLFQRLQKRIKEKQQARNLGDSELPPEQFGNMSQVFNSILDKYKELLEKNGTLLQTNAVGALVNEICADLGFSRGEIGSTPENKQRFERAFRQRLDDLIAKARPMIRYSETNTQNYFLEESEDELLDVSKMYCHFGFSPESAAEIRQMFPVAMGDGDQFASFRSLMRMDKNDGLQADPAFKDNEIFCFCAVHCLQPTQIYHFIENQQEDSYYPDYKARITSGVLSDNPHLDKRWTLRGSMPYISASLELAWRKDVLKALIYEVLKGKISFTVDRFNTRCFVRQEEDAQKFLCWPKGEQILTRNVSRLVEYLAEDEELVELEAKKLDELVQRYARRLSNGYADTPKMYKQGMTKDKLLSLLRRDMITFLQTDKAIKSAKLAEDEEEDTAIDLELSMGGVLHVAYLLHSSEERLGEDKDYGEGLIAAAADIIDQYALGMHGASEVGSGSYLDKDYVEIYNWAAEKFFEDWLKRAVKEYHAEPEPAAPDAPAKPGNSRMDRLFESDEPVQSTKTARADVPDAIRRTSEYIWIENNWKFKKFQEN